MDSFKNAADSLISPAKDAFRITPHDQDNLPTVAKAVYVGTGGDIVLRAVDSALDVRFANVAAGAILPIRVLAVRLTGTTASDIVGLL